MQEHMNIGPKDKRTNQPSVQAHGAEELSQLRDELWRIAEEVRMKSKGSSADVQRTRCALEREVQRFSDQVNEAADHAYDDVKVVGDVLRMRLEKLANHIALPAS